ncbi:LysR substrate binding domain protein [compost metagenome]
MRQLALAGAGIACLSEFMTEADCAAGDLVQVLMRDTLEVRQPVHAVYYRNTELASRIRCFVDFLALRLASR